MFDLVQVVNQGVIVFALKAVENKSPPPLPLKSRIFFGLICNCLNCNYQLGAVSKCISLSTLLFKTFNLFIFWYSEDYYAECHAKA